VAAGRQPVPRGERALLVRLDAYREAVEAALFLRGCLHDPAWLKEVTVELAPDGGARVAVVLLWETTLIRRCLPSRVNGIEVVLREGR
jgi:hypothetical protein